MGKSDHGPDLNILMLKLNWTNKKQWEHSGFLALSPGFPWLLGYVLPHPWGWPPPTLYPIHWQCAFRREKWPANCWTEGHCPPSLPLTPFQYVAFWGVLFWDIFSQRNALSVLLRWYSSPDFLSFPCLSLWLFTVSSDFYSLRLLALSFRGFSFSDLTLRAMKSQFSQTWTWRPGLCLYLCLPESPSSHPPFLSPLISPYIPPSRPWASPAY